MFGGTYRRIHRFDWAKPAVTRLVAPGPHGAELCPRLLGGSRHGAAHGSLCHLPATVCFANWVMHHLDGKSALSENRSGVGFFFTNEFHPNGGTRGYYYKIMTQRQIRRDGLI